MSLLPLRIRRMKTSLTSTVSYTNYDYQMRLNKDNNTRDFAKGIEQSRANKSNRIHNTSLENCA